MIRSGARPPADEYCFSVDIFRREGLSGYAVITGWDPAAFAADEDPRAMLHKFADLLSQSAVAMRVTADQLSLSDQS